MSVLIPRPSVGNYKFLGSNLPFTSEMIETHSVSIHHAEDRYDGKRCPDCR